MKDAKAPTEKMYVASRGINLGKWVIAKTTSDCTDCRYWAIEKHNVTFPSSHIFPLSIYAVPMDVTLIAKGLYRTCEWSSLFLFTPSMSTAEIPAVKTSHTTLVCRKARDNKAIWSIYSQVKCLDGYKIALYDGHHILPSHYSDTGAV